MVVGNVGSSFRYLESLSLPCPKAIGSFYPIGCRGTAIERIFVTWKAFLCLAPKPLALFILLVVGARRMIVFSLSGKPFSAVPLRNLIFLSYWLSGHGV
ncbi:hypothetical protein, partial [Microseira wollei]|uniref:hypothetical protein n=1 Tax=Microseira wollei TaxID=467598 RepID=UPI001CFC5A29